MQDDTVSSSSAHGSPQNGSFSIGQLIDGKYQIISLLGRGGMGEVYRVRHLALGVDYALKSIDIQKLEDGLALRRFQAEARTTINLKHPNLIEMRDFGVLENGRPYLIMELAEGTTLQDHLKAVGKLSVPQALTVFQHVSRALAYAHEKHVVHRDLKPANIMLTNISDTECGVKVLDFGIAKILDEDESQIEALTKTGDVFGSPLYMSPEQCSGAQITPRSDMYSLGCVMFESLTGAPPFLGKNPLRTMMMHQSEPAPSLRQGSFGVNFAPPLENLVASLLAKDPNLRPSSLDEVADQLHNILYGKTAAEISVKTPDGVAKKSKMPAVLIASCIVVSTFAAGIYFFSAQTKEDISRKKSAEKPVALNEDLNQIATGQDALVNTGNEIDQKSIDSWERCGPIKVVFRNKQYKTIQFPDRMLGKVFVLQPAAKLYSGKEFLARDKVSVPAIGELVLHLSERIVPTLFSNTAVFNKIDPAIFDGLSLGGPLNERGSMAMFVPGSNLDAEKRNMRSGVYSFLQRALTWTKLTRLFLRDLAITEGSAALVGQLPHLNGLVINGCSPETLTFLGHQKSLSRLKNVSLNNCGPISNFLKDISSAQLDELEIGYDTTLNSDDVEALKKFGKIDRLMIRHTVSAPLLKELTALKNVRKLETAGAGKAPDKS